MTRFTNTYSRGSALALLMIVALLNGGCFGKSGNAPITHAPAEYSKIVSTFMVGALALETDDPTHQATYLQKMTEIAPEEPAGWANFALFQMTRNQLKEAGESLKKATELAPANAEIEKLEAQLADKNGDLPNAIKHYQKAVQLAPGDLRAQYSLANQLERQNSPEGDAAYQGAMQAILDRQPYNLIAQIKIVRMAAKRGDKATLEKVIPLLETRSATFSADPTSRFKELKADIASGNMKKAAITAQFFGNVLQDNIAFHQSSIVLEKASKEGVNPLLQFIKLPNMPSAPAAPDSAMTFEPAPLLKADTPKAQLAGCTWLNDSGIHLLYSSDGNSVHLDTGVSLPFPRSVNDDGRKLMMGPNSVLSIDMDYDLKSDLVFAGRGGIKFYRQSGEVAFTDVTAKSGLPAATLVSAYTGAWAADIEADGDLDVVLGCQAGTPVVLQNNGDGTWKVTKPFSGVSGLLEFAWVDIDGDGAPDAAMIDGAGKLHIFANQRAGLFKERMLPATVGKSAALAVADLNNDGKLDLISLQADGAILRISDKDRGTDFEVAEVTRWANAPQDIKPGWSRLMVGDLDNNGGTDIIASTASATQIWLCDEKNSYAPLSAPISGPVFTVADLNKDGRLDLIGLSPDGKPIRLINKGTKNYSWQELRPKAKDEEVSGHKITLSERKTSGKKGGSGEPPVNPFGIGGEIESRAGLLYQKQAINSPVVHIGLGSYPSLDYVRVLWPNGDVRAEFEDLLKVNQSVKMEHRLKTSCPFLFTWNGKEMKFVTDCIWRSPLGLKINAQDTAGVAQTEDWIKIRGDQLAPNKDGLYDLRVTAELWETHFFDHLSLMTVDHPDGTNIFVDERFAIPPPPLQVYVTGPTMPVKRAIDDNGTDVSDIVKSRDGRYLDTFGRGQYQGVTRNHWVEIELGEEAPKAGPLWLICYGWIHPTNSSVNVALGQSHLPPPQGLSLETPDAQGHWSVAKPGLGFPEGKVKTILINLDGVFKPGAPRKLRLRTNLEIFWDSIQWAAGRPDIAAKTQHLFAASADLHYRGFSDTRAADSSSPELPQSYDKLTSRAPHWRDLIGYYTRYGDIRELLAKTDDRYVIMNAGDEMRLLFTAPPAPPAGWTRDYVMIGDGWVKDGDPNTTFSKTVLPLPYHGQKDYNKPPGRLKDDPAYRLHPKDWQDYHTRYVTPDAFENALVPDKAGK